MAPHHCWRRGAHRAVRRRGDRRVHAAEASGHRRARGLRGRRDAHRALGSRAGPARQARGGDRHGRLGRAGDPVDRPGASSKLTVFQRTPIWCLPKLDRPLRARTRKLLRLGPPARRAPRGSRARRSSRLTFPLPRALPRHRPPVPRRRKVGRDFLRSEVHDPDVRDKLTPRYALGCKRPSLLERVPGDVQPRQRPPRDGADRDDHAAGVRVADGTEHAVDALVLATGFKVFESGNMPPFPIRGRDGVDLEQWWDDNRYQAYEGVSVPGFPNLFTILGPYGYNGAVLLPPDRDPGAAHRPLPQARPADRLHARRDHARGQRPLLQGDARPASQPDLLPADLLVRQQLLLRPPRRRAVQAGHEPRDELAQRSLRPRRLPLRSLPQQVVAAYLIVSLKLPVMPPVSVSIEPIRSPRALVTI